MDVSSTGSAGTAGTQGRVVQLNAVARAAAQFAANEQHTVPSHWVGASGSNSTNAPNVNTSPTYSPALYAQAAQYAVYSQSGALSSLTQSAKTNDSSGSAEGGDTEIHAVEESSSSHVDAKA